MGRRNTQSRVERASPSLLTQWGFEPENKRVGSFGRSGLGGHFKTGQRNIILDEPVLPYRMAVWQPQSDPIRPLLSDHQPGILQNLIPVFCSFRWELSFER